MPHQLDADAQAHSRSGVGTEAALLARLEALLASAPLGVAFLDRTLRVERVNTALASVLGIPAGECRGRTVAELIPGLAEILVPVLELVLARGETVPEFEFSGVAPGCGAGTRYWLSAFFPVSTSDGGLAGVGIILRDITARHEAMMRESRRTRHREALHALTAALGEALTAREIVRAVVANIASMFGAAGVVIARRTADGHDVETLGSAGMPTDAESKWALFPLAAHVPLAHVTRTGESLFLESVEERERRFPEPNAFADAGLHANAIVPLMVESHPIGALGIAFRQARTFDEEERALVVSVARQCSLALERARLIHSERAARAEADAANQVKTQFLATMSHELRTPLNAIGGYTELLEMEIHGPVTAAQREVLVRIQRSQQHLLNLVNNVLNLVKLDTHHVHYHFAQVAMDQVLQFVAEATGPQLQAKRLRYEQAPCEGVSVRADPEKLRQILINLLSNAIKFTDEGGKITMVCKVEGTQVRTDVHDTGCGIPAEQIDTIFDPFVQVDRRLNRPIEGTGLGLAISRELALGMSGQLTVESVVGVGSTFTLRLPQA